MDASDYLAMLRRYWRGILLLTLAGALAGLGGALTATTSYTSSAKVLFMGSDGPTIQLAVQSYADLARTETVLQPAADELGVGDLRTLLGQLTVDSSLTSQVVTISATDEDAERSTEIANAVAASLVEQAEALAAEIDGEVTKATVVQRATLPPGPSGPERGLYVAGGALAGLLVGLAQALVRFWRGRAARA